MVLGGWLLGGCWGMGRGARGIFWWRNSRPGPRLEQVFDELQVDMSGEIWLADETFGGSHKQQANMACSSGFLSAVATFLEGCCKVETWHFSLVSATF